MSFVTRASESRAIVIATGQKYSGSFSVKGYGFGSIQVGAAITSANFTMEVSLDGTNWTALQDVAGSAVAAVPCTANESCPLPEGVFRYPFARVKTASDEGAERTWLVFLQL